MTILMDDPTTYLAKDTENVVIVLGKSLASVQDLARQYGVSIQVNMPGNIGIRAVTTLAEAQTAVATFPASTPWCVEGPALAPTPTDQTYKTRYDTLRNRFGLPKTVAVALGVETDGIAWRPDKYPVV